MIKSKKGVPWTLLMAIIFGGLFLILFFKVIIAVAPHMDVTQVACPVFCEQRNKAVEDSNALDYVAFYNFYGGNKGWNLDAPFDALSQHIAHTVDPRNDYVPSSMGCYCGVTKLKGPFLHVKSDWDGTGNHLTLWEFHLTNEDPWEHRKSYVKENFNHKDDCELSEDEMKGIVKNPGCWIYAVDHNSGGPDGCKLYNVSEGAVLNGTIGSSIEQDLGASHVHSESNWEDNGDGFDSPISMAHLHFGQDEGDLGKDFRVEYGHNVHVSQRFLMKEPGEHNFTLWKRVICKSTARDERMVPPDTCAQTCANKVCGDKMYYNSMCNTTEPADFYESVSDSKCSGSACCSESGDTCWCACAPTNKYYWSVMDTTSSVT